MCKHGYTTEPMRYGAIVCGDCALSRYSFIARINRLWDRIEELSEPIGNALIAVGLAIAAAGLIWIAAHAGLN